MGAEPLTFERIEEILTGNMKLELTPEVKERIQRCRDYLDRKIETQSEPLYGITTGFGSLCNKNISPDELSTLQENLVKSHACSVGDEVSPVIVRLMMLLKAHALSLGHSGVQVITVQRILDFFNNDVLPIVYDRGSLGASGDLAPLANLFLPLIGVGDVYYKGKKREAISVLDEFAWKPVRLMSKEGLALLNGTQFMSANGVFALSAITALTAQNTTGVTDIFDSTPHFLAEQLDAVFTDIFPDAVKIGMVSSAELISVIAEKLHTYGAKHIVVDPMMVATSGSKLLQDSAIQILTGQLLPMAEVVTPNIPEAEILSGMTITDAAGMEAAAKCISEKYGCAVLCKGGHKVNDADDLLWRNGSGKWFHGERIANPNTHGTGCTLSSAIASNLAKGYPLDAAVERAKAYISGCLSAMLDLGKGSGPMDHMFALRGEFVEH